MYIPNDDSDKKKMISQIIQIQNVNYSDVDFGLWNNRSGASNWSAELRSLFASLLSCQGLSCQYWFIHPSQIWINQLPNFFHSPCLEMCARVREACLTLDGIDFQINFKIFRAEGYSIAYISQITIGQVYLPRYAKWTITVHHRWISQNFFSINFCILTSTRYNRYCIPKLYVLLLKGFE